MTIINYNVKQPEPEWIWWKIIWRNESHRKWANSLAVVIVFFFFCCSAGCGCLKVWRKRGSDGYKIAWRRSQDSICWCHLSLCWLFTGLKDWKQEKYRAPWQMFTIPCSFSFSSTSLLPVFLFFSSICCWLRRSHLFCYLLCVCLVFFFIYFAFTARCYCWYCCSTFI